MKKEIIDMEDVMERVQDDMELLMELLDIFENDFKEKRVRSDQLVAAGENEQLRDMAHSLKGAAGNISAKSIDATCLKFEQLANSRGSGKHIRNEPDARRIHHTVLLFHKP